PLLMIGGSFLCFEGAEKLVHKFLHPQDEAAAEAAIHVALADPDVDLVQLEKTKIKGAIRTDFILSAEIIVISLGAAAGAGLVQRFGVLTAIAVIMTVGVYGLVAGIVKLDDAGLALIKRQSNLAQALGRGILFMAPKLMKFLSVAGTTAMFLVGGGIVVHGIAPLHHGQVALEQALTQPWSHCCSTRGSLASCWVRPLSAWWSWSKSQGRSGARDKEALNNAILAFSEHAE